jgi:hypothetical protein
MDGTAYWTAFLLSVRSRVANSLHMGLAEVPLCPAVDTETYHEDPTPATVVHVATLSFKRVQDPAVASNTCDTPLP